MADHNENFAPNANPEHTKAQQPSGTGTTRRPDQTQPTGTSSSSSRDTKREASWPSVLFYIHLNILGVYGAFVLFSHTSLLTCVFTFLLTLFGILGVTAGAHRLWAHRTYEATPLLRFTLMIFQTLAGQVRKRFNCSTARLLDSESFANGRESFGQSSSVPFLWRCIGDSSVSFHPSQGSIYDWVRMHRLHHEKFRTVDDPYYSDKNFLHAQVFANIRKLSPRQEELLEAVDMSDIEADSIVMFQRRFYWLMYLVLFVLLPINAPLEYWGDTVQAAIFVAFSLRYLIVLNVAWLINSAHFVWGLDKSHKQSDSNMVFLVTKSYWPQYHYLLPFDYQSGEFGNYGSGCTTAFIRICAAVGQATKLQTMTTEAVKRGLTMAVDSGKPIVECLKQAGAEDMCNLKREHYLQNERLH
uniref:Fatty acid desaturase domain-containing protein n=1 Tax=Anopheles epiroticus TaxID=199890 RepID=A0A182PAC8_9DIPT